MPVLQDAPKHRQSLLMLCYCCVTGVSVWLSVRRHQSFNEWLTHSDWSVFLLWHLQFHIWYLIYHTLNFFFLGALRPFERRKARKSQLAHLISLLIFIIVICGLDIFEGFCWLHWATPFTFLRMSLIVISERLENPVLSQSTILSNITNTASHAVPLETPDFSSSKNTTPDPLSDPTAAPALAEERSNPSSFDSPHITISTSDPDVLCMYLLILLLIFIFWCFCGSLVFKPLPLWSQLMVLYEPVVCLLQWIEVACCVVLCDSRSVLGISKHDIKFSVEWTSRALCQILSTVRYASIWMLFGHSLIFNVADVLIFMKLKNCFTGISASIHSLRVFLLVRKILSKSLPTVYPSVPPPSPGKLPLLRWLFNNSNNTEMKESKESSPICVVCRDPMVSAKQLPCAHILHEHCLRQWLDSDLTCPVCRTRCLTDADERALRGLLGKPASPFQATPDPQTTPDPRASAAQHVPNSVDPVL